MARTSNPTIPEHNFRGIICDHDEPTYDCACHESRPWLTDVEGLEPDASIEWAKWFSGKCSLFN